MTLCLSQLIIDWLHWVYIFPKSNITVFLTRKGFNIILGFLNTGDEYSPGNMALKDQVLALKFVRDHIIAFGGDPKAVTLAGQSSGSRSIILHLVSRMSKGLFHRAIAMSGSMTTPIPPQREQLEMVRKVAYLLNCTTETTEQMVQCLRERPAQELGDIIPSFKVASETVANYETYFIFILLTK